MYINKLETKTLTGYIPRNTDRKAPIFISHNAEFLSLSNDVNLIEIEWEEEEKNEKNEQEKAKNILAIN